MLENVVLANVLLVNVVFVQCSNVVSKQAPHLGDSER